MPDPKSLHIRIVAPFTLLFAGVIVVSLFLERYYVSRIMDERIGRQAEHIAHVLARSEFILNPIYIHKLKELLDGEVVVYNGSGRAVLSTFPANTAHSYREVIDPKENLRLLAGQDFVRRTIEHAGQSYLLVSRKLPPTYLGQDTVLTFISPLSDIEYVKAQISMRLCLIGGAGLLLVTLSAFLISRSVTRPVQNLVTVTQEIAEGNFEKKSHLPSIRELSRLALAINTMGDKMKAYEEDLVRSSQWAAAGKIAGVVAHEVRNPLSSIKMMVQLLRNKLEQDSADQKIVQTLLEEISRLERTINELVERVKPSSLTMESCDLNTVFDEVLQIMGPKLDHRKIRVARNFAPLSKVPIDKDKMKQVIWNLMLNAADSMPAGGAITVSTRDNAPEGRIEADIEDEGSGISEKITEKLFTQFFTTKPGGLGLGLATSKRIIEGHNGSLAIENRPEGGVRATIILPVQ